MSHGKKWSSSLWHTIFFKACIEKRTFVLTGVKQGISKCTHYKYTFVCLINQADGSVIVQGLRYSNDLEVDFVYIKKIFTVDIRDTVPPFPETTWKSGKLFWIFLAV